MNSVGSAFVVYESGNEIINRTYRLPSYCSVYQAELYAILKALEYIDTNNVRLAIIHTDSNSSLEALKQRNPTTPIVHRIQELLLLLARNRKTVKIRWVKAHIGVVGNERADELAKESTTKDDNQIQTDIFAPISFVKRILLTRFRSEWNRNWQISTKGRWTSKIFPTIEDRAKCKISISHEITQLLSNHGKHREYLARFKVSQSANCRFCAYPSESYEHLIFNCNKFATDRFELETQTLSENIVFNISNLSRIMQNCKTLNNFLFLFHAIISQL
jgi:ribonuclease HI